MYVYDHEKLNGTLVVDSLSTSRRIYRLVLPLRAPETLYSLNKLRIPLFNVHLYLFI